MKSWSSWTTRSSSSRASAGSFRKVRRHRMLHVAAQYQPIFRRIGLDADLIFSHPLIKPWRTLDDRENCTLDATRDDGSPIRLHIKRYQPVRRRTTPADDEVEGFRLLEA